MPIHLPHLLWKTASLTLPSPQLWRTTTRKPQIANTPFALLSQFYIPLRGEKKKSITIIQHYVFYRYKHEISVNSNNISPTDMAAASVGKEKGKNGGNIPLS